MQVGGLSQADIDALPLIVVRVSKAAAEDQPPLGEAAGGGAGKESADVEKGSGVATAEHPLSAETDAAQPLENLAVEDGAAGRRGSTRGTGGGLADRTFELIDRMLGRRPAAGQADAQQCNISDGGSCDDDTSCRDACSISSEDGAVGDPGSSHPHKPPGE